MKVVYVPHLYCVASIPLLLFFQIIISIHKLSKNMNSTKEKLIESVVQKHKIKSPKKKLNSSQKSNPLKIKINAGSKRGNTKDEVDSLLKRRRLRNSSGHSSSLTASVFDPNEISMRENISDIEISLDNFPSGVKEETNIMSSHERNGELNQSSTTNERKPEFLFNFYGQISMLLTAKDDDPLNTALKKDQFKIRFLLEYIKKNDFEIPCLNQETWTNWPSSKPSKNEVKHIKEKFPSFTRKWTIDEENRYLFKNLKLNPLF